MREGAIRHANDALEASCRQDPAILIHAHRRSRRNVVVDPFSIVDIQAHASVRDVITQTSVQDAAARTIQHGMEEVVAVELRIVIAAVIAMAEHVALLAHLEGPRHRRGRIRARGAGEAANLVAETLRTLVDRHPIAIGVDNDQVVRIAVERIGVDEVGIGDPTARSGQLPPYVLRPVSYGDVQSVVRRVRTGQPVVLVLKNTNTEVAKRILDFSFGFSYGIEGSVEEIGERVFVVLPQGSQLSQADLDKLAVDGDITK